MAEPVWTAPFTFTAALVTVAQLNQYLSQNDVYLHGPRGQYPAQVDVVSSTTETNILSHTVNADDLGSNRMLRATVIGDFKHNTGGAAANLTLRVKFGGTTLYAAVKSVSTQANRGTFEILVLLGMLNSASSQYLAGHIMASDRVTLPTTGLGRLDSTGEINTAIGGNGTASIATTSNQTLVVSAEWSVNNSETSFRKHYALVELI